LKRIDGRALPCVKIITKNKDTQTNRKTSLRPLH